MTIWWLNNISRAKLERERLGALVDETSWLKNLEISLGDGNLRVEFDIEHGANLWGLVLTYPVVFPDAPPLVTTRDGKRISGHQYGSDGELCLEYRPENWHPDVTGAMMVQSAYNLLSGENPKGGGGAALVRDGHAVTIGQATRMADGRFVLTSNDWAALQELEPNRIHKAEIGLIALDRKISTRLIQLGSADSFSYQSASRIPNVIIKSEIFVLRGGHVNLSGSPTPSDVFAWIDKAEIKDFDSTIIEESRNFYLLASQDSRWTLYYVAFSEDEPFVHVYQTLFEGNQARRLPAELEAVSRKRIGIVGCGSLGAKVAMQLARANIGNFLLIDDDVFFEGNLVRHTLTSVDIGFHKATALRHKMLEVNPSTEIETRLIRLGGQESSASTVSAMAQLAECDVLVDATADSSAFSFVAAVAKRNKIPVFWGSVFAGGIGGTVGRALPDKTPEPLESKRQIWKWCQERGVEAEQPVAEVDAYAAHREDGRVEIATDSDVSVIASHVCRLVIDTLINLEDSAFPYSAYVIGMSKGWIFYAPFDTRPIEYVGSVEWAADQTPASEKELVAFLEDLIPKEAEGAA